MIDSAKTVTILSKQLKDRGAKSVYVVAAHGIFSDNAMERIENSPIDEVFVTNSLPLPKNSSTKIRQVSVAPLLARVIWTEHFRANVGDEDFDLEWEQEN